MRFLTHSFFVLALCLDWRGVPARAAQPPAPASSIPSVVTASGEAYLPGTVQMVSSAQVESVLLHPQGRYALILQSEASLPPASLAGKQTTGAVALLLYDSRSNKTRILWEGHAGKVNYHVFPKWLPGTDCAVAVTHEFYYADSNTTPPQNRSSLLFFNFEKSLSPRTLMTSPEALNVNVSQTKPIFFLTSVLTSTKGTETEITAQQLCRGDARGILGAPLTFSSSTFLGGFRADGGAVYGMEIVSQAPATPNDAPSEVFHYFEWDGISATPAPQPAVKRYEAEPALPQLPLAAHTTLLPVPPITKAEPTETLHPLYLKATDTPEDAPNHFVRIAPDATQSYLLADKSAVLYKSGGALYAVPLVHLSKAEFGDAQKTKARQTTMVNAKRVGLGILGYAMKTQGTFPPAGIFNAAITPYIKEASLLNGFVYTPPLGTTLASIEMPATIPMGYIAVQGVGRAVLYVDGHVKWEDPQ